MNNTAVSTPKMTFWQTVSKVFLFSLPIIANFLLNMVPYWVSIWILARLGKDQLAAAAIAAPTVYTVMIFFSSVLYAVGIKVGYCFGQDKVNSEIGVWVRNAFFLVMLLSIPAVIILLNLHYLLALFGQSSHLINLSKPYFLFAVPVLVLFLFNTVISSYFSGIGRPKIAFFFSIAMLPLVVILSYILILGKLGMPALGLAGMNCATAIVYFIQLILGLIVMHSAKWSRPFAVLSFPVGICKARCVDLFKLGWPISLQVTGEQGALTIVMYLLGWFGVSVLASAQIVGQYTMMFIMMSIGLSSGVAVLTSQAQGQSDAMLLRQITRAGLAIITGICAVFIVAFLVFPIPMIDIYISSKVPHHVDVVRYAVDFMMIAALYIAFDGVRNVLTGSLRGLQDPKVPMRIGVSCFWLLGLPFSWLVGFYFHGGPVLMRLSFCIGVIVATILLSIRYRIILYKLLPSLSLE